MKYDLPIKYAIEPVFPYASGNGNLLGYIVTKCYVLEKNTRYLPDGSVKNRITIVYPFKGLQTFKFMKDKRTPEFDNFGNYRNIDYTEKVYDTYLEAKEECKKLNTSLFSSIYPCYQVDDMLKQFGDFEFQVMKKCNDMEVTDDEEY